MLLKYDNNFINFLLQIYFTTIKYIKYIKYINDIRYINRQIDI